MISRYVLQVSRKLFYYNCLQTIFLKPQVGHLKKSWPVIDHKTYFAVIIYFLRGERVNECDDVTPDAALAKKRNYRFAISPGAEMRKTCKRERVCRRGYGLRFTRVYRVCIVRERPFCGRWIYGAQKGRPAFRVEWREGTGACRKCRNGAGRCSTRACRTREKCEAVHFSIVRSSQKWSAENVNRVNITRNKYEKIQIVTRYTQQNS